MKARLTIAALLLSLSLTASVFAADGNPKAPQGITVSPAFQQIDIKGGQDKRPVTFKITNNESTDQHLALSAADFNTLGESGGLFFVGTNPTELQKKYGLAKWLSLPQKDLTIKSHQSITINASILNLPDLSPGGHYGALMISAGNNSSEASGNNKIALHPIASSLMFVTKLGGDTHSLSLASVEVPHNIFKLPKTVKLRFHNTGNSHVVPRGVVTLTDARGNTVKKGIINSDSNIILPETYRQFYVPLSDVSDAKSIGKYSLKVDFRFDGMNLYRAYQTNLIYVPLIFLIVILLLVAALIVLVAKKGLPRKIRRGR